MNNTPEHRNKPFNGDFLILEKFKQIVKDYGIDTIVETGTHLGETTLHLCDLVPNVISYETNTNWFNGAKDYLKEKKVSLYQMNSVDGFKRDLPGLVGKVLFFLDAHWEDYNPLLDELKEIALAGLKPVIAIHDFKVPGKPELGYDSYKGQDYDWEWIKPSIEKIYGTGYKIEYNTEAQGMNRGIIYIFPQEEVKEPKPIKKRRAMSPETKAKIAEGQKKRWEKVHGVSGDK